MTDKTESKKRYRTEQAKISPVQSSPVHNNDTLFLDICQADYANMDKNH